MCIRDSLFSYFHWLYRFNIDSLNLLFLGGDYFEADLQLAGQVHKEEQLNAIVLLREWKLPRGRGKSPSNERKSAHS